MSMIVYKATSPSGKVYIGLTTQKLSYRQKCHKHLALKTKKKNKFYSAIRKYGYDNIKWEIIYTTNNHKELLKKEQEFIKLYNSQINGYNITNGGEGTLGVIPWCKGKKYKISETARKSLAYRRKPVISINLITKEILEFDSRKSCSEKLNLIYEAVKTSIRLKQTLHGYRIINKKDFNINNKDLFNPKIIGNSIQFDITNGISIEKMTSINNLCRFLKISERAARNMYYKNKEINGWKLCL